MDITLSKSSEVPLWRQLAEQIVFLITTGKLKIGQPLPSVRALARRANVHHNTVSDAYQDLVRRKWVTRRRGSRLVVGARAGAAKSSPSSLDELINDSIQRAREMGYSLQALTERVRERLLAEPPDHVLVIEEESGLCEIIREEVTAVLGCPVESCSPNRFASEPVLAIGSQVFAPHFALEELQSLIPGSRPGVPILYSGADLHVELIHKLKMPSTIAAVSISESVLKTARSLFAPAIGRKHTFQAILLRQNERLKLPGVDVAFCDSIAMDAVSSRRKIHYQLVDPKCLEHLAMSITIGPQI